ncbi:MAG: NACHT domain-containing protein, partial [Mycobacterium sp.]|nr:NACHT domain-containing protein [Mycobacterium sp.]
MSGVSDDNFAAPGAGSVNAGRDIINSVVATTLTTGGSKRLADEIVNHAPLIDDLDLAHFTGREWLIREIDNTIARQEKGYVIIRSEAGIGKTALAAHLASERSCVCHFAGLPGGSQPERARRNLAAQLVQYWELADQLCPGGAPPATEDEPSWLLTTLHEAAAARDRYEPAAPLVLVVDGLDEADAPVRGRDTGIPFGLPVPEHLPRKTHVVVTSRSGVELSRLRSSTTGWHEIEVEGERNLADLRAYIQRMADEPGTKLAKALREENQTPVGSLVDTLCERCGGVWIYARYVLDEIADRTCVPAQIDRLPERLAGYYEVQINRWKRQDDWDFIGEPVLAALAALRRPAGRDELASIAGADQKKTGRWLNELLRPFINRIDRSGQHLYSIRHQSLRDLFENTTLDDEVDAGLRQQLHHAICAAHRRITDALSPSDGDWTTLDDYGCAWLPDHAAAGGKLDELVLQPGFLLAVQPPALLRQGHALASTRARRALGAYELALEAWAREPNYESRLWSLHVTARRSRCHALADACTIGQPWPWRTRAASWSGIPHRTLTDHGDQVWSVCAVPDVDGHTLIASCSDDRSVRVWNPATGQQIGDPLPEHTTSICAVPDVDGRTLIASGNGPVRLWDPATGTYVGTLLTSDIDGVASLSAVPDVCGRTLVAGGCFEGAIRLWDPTTGQQIGAPFTGHTDCVSSVCALPDIHGRTLIASGSDDGSVRLWDPETGRQMGEPLTGHTGRVRSVCAVPDVDGRTLIASGGDDGSVRLWDT